MPRLQQLQEGHRQLQSEHAELALEAQRQKEALQEHAASWQQLSRALNCDDRRDEVIARIGQA